MAERKTNLSGITVETKFVRNKTEFISSTYLTQYTDSDIMFVKLKFNDLTIDNKLILGRLQFGIKTSKTSKINFKIAPIYEDLEMNSDNLCFYARVDDVNYLIDKDFELNTDSTFKLYSIDISNILSMMGQNNNTVVLMIKNDNFSHYSTSDMVINSPNYYISEEKVEAWVSKKICLNNQHKFDTFSIGPCQGNISLYNGELFELINLYSGNSKKIPINLNAIFNEKASPSNSFLGGVCFDFDFKGKISIASNYICLKDYLENEEVYVKIESTNERIELGIKHISDHSNYTGVYFNALTGKYFFTNIETINGNSINVINLYDKHDNFYKYQYDNSNINLLSVKDIHDNTITYNYDSSYFKVNSIVSSDGDTLSLNYDSNGKLINLVSSYSDTKVVIEYLSDKLKIYQDRNSVNLLTKLFDVSLYFSNTGLSSIKDNILNRELIYSMSNYKVNKVEDKIGSYYLMQNNYMYDDNYTKVTNIKNEFLEYYFDDAGKLKVVSNEKGVCSNFVYNNISNNLSNVIGTPRVITHSRNLLEEGDFESFSTWTKNNFGTSTNSYFTNKGRDNVCLTIVRNGGSNPSIEKTIYGADSGEYNLRGFIKCKSDSSNKEIKIELSGSYFLNGQTVTFNTSYNTFLWKDEWEEFRTNSIKIPEGANTIIFKVKVYFNFSVGEVLLDSFSLGHPSHQNKVNLVKNGYMDFYDSSLTKFNNWTVEEGDYTRSTTSSLRLHPLILGKYVLEIPATSDYSTKKICNTINLRGHAGEVFNLSCYGLVETGAYYTFNLFAKVIYSNLGEKTYSFEFNRYEKRWQMCSGTFVTEDNFTSIIVGVEYNGKNKAQLDCFQLIKDKEQLNINYDIQGNINELNLSKTSVQLIYDDKNRVIKEYCANGLVKEYEYDSNNDLVMIKDNLGTKIRYKYQNHFVTEAQYNEYCERYDYDSNKNLKSFLNTSDVEIYDTYDNLSRLMTSKYGYDATKSFIFNDDHTIDKISVSEPSSIINQFTYTALRDINTINNGNNIYTYNYDSYGRISSFSQNDKVIFAFEYVTDTYNSLNIITNKIRVACIYNETGTIKDRYEYIYLNDDLVSVKLNEKIIVDYVYDGNGKVISAKKYEYDSSLNLIDTIVEKYVYKNGLLIEVLSSKASINKIMVDQKLSKDIYKFSDFNRVIDYVNIDEFNERGFDSYVARLANLYGDEILLPKNNYSGLFGTKLLATSNSTFVDAVNNETGYLYDDMSHYTSIDLKDVHISSNYSKWQEDFQKDKMFYAWIKPTRKLAEGNIFKFYKGNKNSYSHVSSLNLYEDGLIKYVCSDGSRFSSNIRINLNSWNLVGVRFTNLYGNLLTELKIYLNGILVCEDFVEDKIEDINILRICSCENSDLIAGEESSSSSSEEVYSLNSISSRALISGPLSMPIQVMMVGIGCYEYTSEDFPGIYMVGNEILATNQYSLHKIAGTYYYDKMIYSGYEMATLNGTFETSTGRKPTKLIEFDSSFKTAKQRSFFFKENRFIYGSFDPKCKPSLTRNITPLLAYDFNLKSQGRIVMWFNLDSKISTSKKRTIISFGNGTNDVFRVDIENSYCYMYHNEILKCTSLISLSNDTWYLFSMDFTTTLVDVYIDGNKVSNESLTGINLSNLETYVGVSNVKQTRLNGYIELLGYLPTPYSGDGALLGNAFTISYGRPYYLYEVYDNHNILLEKNISSPFYSTSNEISYCRNFTYHEYEQYNKNIDIQYQYDWNNRVKNYNNGFHNVSYDYDKLGRLIKETDSTFNMTTSYTYDNNGNILSKITEDNSEVNIVFTYDSEFKDRLIKVEDTLNNTILNIEYSSSNQLGYPSRIGDNTLVWEGKQLKKYGDIEFFYNADGTRYKKYNPTTGKTTEYIYDGNKIIRMLVSGIVYDFIYDTKGQVVSLSYNNSEYFYERDVLGNILGIIDNKGEFIVKYIYDGFGKVLQTIPGSSIDSGKNSIIENNPFLYKGYCYDVETNLFLVTSRYYSPELGRFIQPADVSTLNPSSINGLNLYSYANNNPISIAYSSSSVGVSVVNQLINQNLSLLIVPNLGINKNNYSSSVHWKNEWFATDWPSFLVFSKTKGALLDWGLSIYKGSLYFDEAENHSIYIGVGNISAFVGYNVEEDKYGVFADANVLSVGYDGRYIDAGISVVGVGFILGWEDKKFRFKIDPPGWFGFDISIDFGQIIKDIFGWEW